MQRQRLLRAAAAALIFAGCAAVSGPEPAAPPTPAPVAAGGLVYAAGQNAATIAVIDGSTHRVVETVELRDHGFSANARPHHIGVERDGSFWYVSLIGENRVLKFDRDNRLVGQLEFEVPGMLAVHPTRDLLLVGRSMSAVNPPQRIGLVRRSDMSVEEVPIFFPRPHAIAVSPDGRYAYSASLGTNQIAVVELESEEVVELIEVDGPPHALVQFAVSPDGRRLVVSTELTHQLLIYDLAEPARPAFVAAVDVGSRPWHPVFTPDSRQVYLGNKGANTVSVVDVESGRVVDVIRHEGIAEPHGAALGPDGRTVYISSNNTGGGDHMGEHAGTDRPGLVVAIDIATRSVVAVIEIGANATGLGSR